MSTRQELTNNISQLQARFITLQQQQNLCQKRLIAKARDSKLLLGVSALAFVVLLLQLRKNKYNHFNLKQLVHFMMVIALAQVKKELKRALL